MMEDNTRSDSNSERATSPQENNIKPHLLNEHVIKVLKVGCNVKAIHKLSPYDFRRFPQST